MYFWLPIWEQKHTAQSFFRIIIVTIKNIKIIRYIFLCQHAGFMITQYTAAALGEPFTHPIQNNFFFKVTCFIL